MNTEHASLPETDDERQSFRRRMVHPTHGFPLATGLVIAKHTQR